MPRLISNNPVTFRALIPKKLMVKNMIAPIRDACIKDAKAMAADLEKVQKTWKGEKARIQSEAKLTPPQTPPYPMFHTGFSASAWPKDDGGKGWLKWLWLDQGTKVRYATMTPKFVPKTRGGQLNSWKGRGGMLFVNKKRPRPGIKARHFIEALAKKWKQPFADHIAKAVEKAAKLSGHGAR